MVKCKFYQNKISSPNQNKNRSIRTIFNTPSTGMHCKHPYYSRAFGSSVYFIFSCEGDFAEKCVMPESLKHIKSP